MTIRFDNFEIDLSTREVRRNDVPLGIEPKVFDLLVFLINNANRVVSRDDMIGAVWDGRILSDATVSSCVKAVRNALGDDGKTQKFVRTIHGRGFRFVGSFTDHDAECSTGLARTETKGASLAILPFDVAGNDPGLVALGTALADDLLTMLNRIPLLSLASHRAAQAMAVDPVRTPDVTYLVDGSLSRSGKNLRAHIQLVRTESGFHSWAQRFEVPGEGATAEALLTAILPRLETAIVETMVADRTQSEGPDSTSAQLIHAMGLLSLKGWNRASFSEAEQVLRDLLARDPRPTNRTRLSCVDSGPRQSDRDFRGQPPPWLPKPLPRQSAPSTLRGVTQSSWESLPVRWPMSVIRTGPSRSCKELSS